MIKERLNDTWARIIIIPIISLVIGVAGNDLHFIAAKDLFLNFIISLLYVTCYWEFNRLFFSYILKKLPDAENSKKRILMHLGFMVVFVLLAGLLLDTANYSIPGLTDQIYFLRNYSKTVERSIFCLGIITVIFECIYFYSLYENTRLENQTLKVAALASRVKEKTEYKSRFLVKSGETFTTVILLDIAYFSYEDKLSFLYTNSGKRLMLDYSLDELEKMVDPKLFFRLNRQYLSSFAAIKSVHNYFNSKLRVHLSPDVTEEVTVSKERAGSLKAWLDA